MRTGSPESGLEVVSGPSVVAHTEPTATVYAGLDLPFPEPASTLPDLALSVPEAVPASSRPERPLTSAASPNAGTVPQVARGGVGAGWPPAGRVPAACLEGVAGVSRGSTLSGPDEISCDRPGCYELFTRTRRSPAQHFCAKPCRRAMERVWQREDAGARGTVWWHEGTVLTGPEIVRKVRKY